MTRRINTGFEGRADEYDDIPAKYKFTKDGQKFVLFDSGYKDKNRIIIFGTPESLSILSDSEFWIMDGTFYVAPSDFEQLYVIQSKVLNVNVPLIYVLMKHRSSSDYDSLFTTLKKITSTEPTYIIIDFEMAVLKSLKNVFTKTQVFGCLFHFGQTIWRKVGVLKLTNEYINNPTINYYFRLFLSLVFVPQNETRKEYLKIKQSILNAGIYEKFQLFIEYFERTFIGRLDTTTLTLSPPMFEISFWSAHSRVLNLLPRTTNSLEGWNRSIRDVVRIAHPNIINLIIALQKEQVYYEKKMLEAAAEHKKPELNENERKLLTICKDYKDYKGLLYLKTLVTLYYWSLETTIMEN